MELKMNIVTRDRGVQKHLYEYKKELIKIRYKRDIKEVSDA